MVALRDRRHLSDALETLAGALESVVIPAGLSGASDDRDRLSGTIRNYILPRVEDPSTPYTVVFAGPTGSGKSTLINSMIGSDVTTAGALRPTTTAPLVVSSSEHADEFEMVGGVECDVVTGRAPVLDKMTFVDTPDIDSTSVEHRAKAETLMDSADVVVFVTSALRYADAVPWQVLRRAVSRGSTVVHVLNRVGSATSGANVDFRTRLRAAGMDDEIITVPEHHMQPGSQQVPLLAVKALRRRLTEIAMDREGTAGTTLDRVLVSVLGQATELVRALDQHIETRQDLEVTLSLELSARADELTFDGVAVDSYTPLPDLPTGRRLRRWIQSNRHDEPLDRDRVETVIGSVVDIVESDLRRWLAECRSDLALSGLPGDFTVAQLQPTIDSAVTGWADYVRRIADEYDPADRWLLVGVLLDAATSSRDVPAAEVVFGDESGLVVERAHRELQNRVAVVYEQAAAVVADAILPGGADVDDSDLRAALGAVNSAVAPVYA